MYFTKEKYIWIILLPGQIKPQYGISNCLIFIIFFPFFNSLQVLLIHLLPLDIMLLLIEPTAFILLIQIPAFTGCCLAPQPLGGTLSGSSFAKGFSLPSVE